MQFREFLEFYTPLLICTELKVSCHMHEMNYCFACNYCNYWVTLVRIHCHFFWWTIRWSKKSSCTSGNARTICIHAWNMANIVFLMKGSRHSQAILCFKRLSSSVWKNEQIINLVFLFPGFINQPFTLTSNKHVDLIHMCTLLHETIIISQSKLN